MPTVLRWKGHRFFFWSGGRDEPPHAHVDHASKSVKIWLETLKVAYNDGYALHEVNAILNVVVYRARFFGHKAALCGLVRGDGCGHPVPPCFGGASVAVLFQEPVLVVAIEVRPDGGADLLDVLEDTSENDLLLQRADEALGDAVGFRLTDESEAGRHAEEPQLVLEVLGHEGAAVVVTQQHLARGIRADGSEHPADGQRQRLSGGITVSMLATCQPRPSAFQCSATMNSVTFPSSTVGITAPSAPHMTFGASVVIELPWSFAGRGGRRCGESRLFSPMIRSTRVRLTRMPSMTRSRAHTLRWPSPVHGERARSRRMAASRSASPSAGFGPRRPAGLSGGRPSWRRAS